MKQEFMKRYQLVEIDEQLTGTVKENERNRETASYMFKTIYKVKSTFVRENKRCEGLKVS